MEVKFMDEGTQLHIPATSSLGKEFQYSQPRNL
jgi:hypothetical protein